MVRSFALYCIRPGRRVRVVLTCVHTYMHGEYIQEIIMNQFWYRVRCAFRSCQTINHNQSICSMNHSVPFSFDSRIFLLFFPLLVVCVVSLLPVHPFSPCTFAPIPLFLFCANKPNCAPSCLFLSLLEITTSFRMGTVLCQLLGRFPSYFVVVVVVYFLPKSRWNTRSSRRQQQPIRC